VHTVCLAAAPALKAVAFFFTGALPASGTSDVICGNAAVRTFDTE